VQWAVLFDGFMVEARWLATDQVPMAEDYLRNGVITSGVPLTFLHIFSMLGYDDDRSTEEEEEAIIDHMPSIISCPAKILRLWDDMGSAEVVVSSSNHTLHTSLLIECFYLQILQSNHT
jgi:(3S)-linalool synthase